MPTTTPTVTIQDNGVSLYVLVDYHYGNGPRLAASYPTGSGAAYPEARRQGRADAERKALAHAGEILALHGEC